MSRQQPRHMRLRDEPTRTPLKESMITYELTSPIAAIFAYKGTILPLVAARAEAWIFVGVHVVLLILNDVAGVIDIDAFLGVDPLKTMGILTALLSFFIVCRTPQCSNPRLSRMRHLLSTGSRPAVSRLHVAVAQPLYDLLSVVHGHLGLAAADRLTNFRAPGGLPG